MPRLFLPAIFVAIAASAETRISATVRGADGFVYATGVTNSPDFPATNEPWAWQSAHRVNHTTFPIHGRTKPESS
jgi:hypothetical protein